MSKKNRKIAKRPTIIEKNKVADWAVVAGTMVLGGYKTLRSAKKKAKAMHGDKAAFVCRFRNARNGREVTWQDHPSIVAGKVTIHVAP